MQDAVQGSVLTYSEPNNRHGTPSRAGPFWRAGFIGAVPVFVVVMLLLLLLHAPLLAGVLLCAHVNK